MTPALAVPPPLDLQRCALAGTQLIEASAGTGKTWAICALVLRLLVEARLEIGQILVVTFTNAATAELRERIRARLQAAQAEWQVPGSSGDAFLVPWMAALRAAAGQDAAAHAAVGQRLADALQGFDEAAVFTIHGFCQRALADAAFSAGMPLVLTPISDDLPLRCQDDLRVLRRWRWDGTHYQRTSEAWLANMDAQRETLMPLFHRVYGAEAERWWVR